MGVWARLGMVGIGFGSFDEGFPPIVVFSLASVWTLGVVVDTLYAHMAGNHANGD